MMMLMLVGLLLVATCAALLARAIAMPRLRVVRRVNEIAAYGFDAQPQIAESQGAPVGVLNGLASTLGGFMAGRFKGLSEAGIRRELMAAGVYRTSPVALLGYRAVCAVAFLLAGLWVATGAHVSAALLIVATPLMPALGWMGPLTLVRRRARRRLQRIDDDLPELVDLLVVTVESGLGFGGSMQLAASRFAGPLGEELRLMLQEQSMGLTTDQALAGMLDRVPTEGMRSFVRSVRQGELLGVPIGQIMRAIADEMRKRRRAAAEERAQKAPIKILFPLVGLIMPALFIVLLVPALLSFMETLGGTS